MIAPTNGIKNAGYGFSTIPSIQQISPSNHHANDEYPGFLGFVMAMEGYAKQSHDGKHAPGHLLWMPCEFEICPEKKVRRCLNILAQPTRLFGLDFDDAGNTLDAVIGALEALNCDYYVHTSMSYIPGTAEKCRAVIHVRDLIHNNDKNAEVFRALVPHFAGHGLVLDQSCKNISRKFYVPGTNLKTGVDCMSYAVLERGALNMTPFLEAERKRAHRAQVLVQMKRSEMARRLRGKTTNPVSQTPYYNTPYDQNIANQKKVQEFMGSASRGSMMASMAMHIVGYCNTRFGVGVVSESLMTQALEDMAGQTTHNAFAKNIADAVRAYKP